MSDWPQLERRLLDSAHRRHRRRRRRALRLVLVPVAIATAAALFVVARPASDERPVATPTPTLAGDRVEQLYGVFRRPQTEADRSVKGSDCTKPGPCFRPETSRRVSRDPQFFLVRSGARDVCVVRLHAGAACGPVSRRQLGAPISSYGRHGGYTVFPDGVERVAYVLLNGQIVYGPVANNFAYLRTEAPVASMSWSVNGRRYVQPILDGQSLVGSSRSGCPKLDARPVEDAARAAATAAATALFQARPEATTARPATAADVGELRTRACGKAIAERSLVVRLTFAHQSPGEVLVGFDDGKAIVWSQLR